jgi:hypothetical protein
MINADKLGKLDARYRPGTRRDNEFAAEEAKLLDELLAAADLGSPTTPNVRFDNQTSDAETAEGEVTWQAPVPAPDQPEEQAVAVWPSAYAAEASVAPTIADTTTTIDPEPGQPSELRRARTIGGTRLGDEPGSPQDLAASADLGAPSSPEGPVSHHTDVADPPHFQVAWQVPAPAPALPEEQAVEVWPSQYDAQAPSTPTVADTTTKIDVDQTGKNDKPRQAWSLDADLPTDEPTPVDELTASVGVSSAAASDLRASDEETEADIAQVAPTWQSATPGAPQDHSVPVWPSAYGTTTPAAPPVPDTTTLEEPSQVVQPHQAWSLDDAEPSAVEPETVAALAAFVDLGVPTTPEPLAGDESGDDESPRLTATSQVTVAAPDQEDKQAGPADQAVEVWPSAFVAEGAVRPPADPTAATDADEPVQVEELHQTQSSEDTGLAAREPEPADVPAPSADLVSAGAPEASSPESTSAAEAPSVAVTSQEAVAPSEQPEEQAVTAPLAADSAEIAVTPAVSDATTPVADKPREFEARHRPWTLRSPKPAVEEPKLFDKPAASADLASPFAPEVSSPETASDAETQPVEVTSPEAEASPEERKKEAETAPPAARSAAMAVTPAASDKAREFVARHRPWALRSAKPAIEEPKLFDEPAASAELAAPVGPEGPSHVETKTAAASQAELTSQAPVSAPQPPEQPPATSWPSAFANRTSPSPTVPVAAPSAEEPHDLDARYRAWVLRAAGEPKPVDRPAASGSLPLAAVPEVPSQVEANAAETSPPEVSAPEQSRERATEVSPSASAAPKPVGPTFAGTTVNRANKPTKPDAPIRAWNFRDIASAVAEPSPIDKPHESEDSEVTVIAGDDASDTDAPPLEVTLHTSTSAPEQPDEDTAASPSADSAPEPPARTVPETAIILPHKPGKLDARYRPWTMSAGELAAEKEEAEVVAGQATAADAHLSPSSSPLDGMPRFQAGALSSATTIPGGKKALRGRVSPTVVTILALVFLLTTLGTGFVAIRQNSAARQWRQYDHSAVAFALSLSTRNAVLTRDLASVRANIAILSSQKAELTGQVKNLQEKLSSGASATRKAFEHSPLFTQITTEAVTAANEASVCAGEMGPLQTEINVDLANPTHKDPLLQGNTRTANLVCTVARQDNQQLQATLRSAH